jgi:dolichol-phosphate mannosyltransferase
MTKLDIIIPVYNEGQNIIDLVRNLESEVTCDFQILVCYDDESDSTLNFLKKYNPVKSNILLIKNPKQGPNSAIQSGIDSSQAEIILVYMADDFENIKIINKMVDLIENGNDLVIPSRFVEGGKMLGAKKIKKIVTVFGSYLIYFIAGIPYKDCTNAFKMFSRNLKEKIKFESTKGFTFALELTAKSYFLKSEICEIPSTWIEVPNRKSNFKIIKWLPYYIYWLLYSILRNLISKLKKNN